MTVLKAKLQKEEQQGSQAIILKEQQDLLKHVC